MSDPTEPRRAKEQPPSEEQQPSDEQQLAEEKLAELQQLAGLRVERELREERQRGKTEFMIYAILGLMLYALYYWLFHK